MPSDGRQGKSASGSAPAPAATAPPAGLPAEVVRTVLPEVPARAQRTITGRFSVRVNVDIDESGTVEEANFASRGPSRYFADLSLRAAQQWRFIPGAGQRRRTIEFTFARSGLPLATLR
jgi:TonB family protein